MALALGLGFSAGVFFFARTVLHYDDRRLLLLDLTVLVAIAMISLVTSRAGPGGDLGEVGEATAPVSRGKAGQKLLFVLMLIALLPAAGSFGELLAGRPHGNWDAWAMWNMKARWLFEGGPRWHLVFGREMEAVRQDYPVFLPLTVARLWCCIGSDSTIVPRLCATLYSTCTLLILFCSVGRMRGALNAILAVTVLAGSQVFIDEGASQYADTPLSCFIICAIVMIAAAGEAGYGMNRLWALAGLAAAAAACTKNEGQLFFAACGLSTFLVYIRQGIWVAARSLGMALVGAIPLLALVMATKLMFAWQNYLFEERTLGDLARLVASPSRWTMVGYWAKTLIASVVHPVLLVLVGTLGIATWLHRRNAEAPRLVGHRIGSLCILFMAAGYLLIYLTTPLEIGWHMRTSFPRLVLQLWPAILFLVFSSCPAIGATKPASAGPEQVTALPSAR